MKKMFYTIIFSTILISSIFTPEAQAATTHASQDVTAYTGSTNGSGGMLFPNKAYSTVAVHPKKNSSTPIYPYGTQIKTKSPLSLNGYGSKSTFTISDTGDILYKRSTYWFDVYFGTSTTTNKNNAKKFGEKKVTYTVYD
ncbi:hypothetical protein [Oceanobacillus neutriphilus]|uniref:3D (Asp-Asp-Asp) domain-containing protein n=1 Tax=Oceanobacillus neutriphilus TaxID=531815 RepID=A0ABQ2NQ20_9BACI|nr:hypothetical protein [Oceanobacillus neutriphilus]GGP08883.1 hypothetical protein GCM10011346_10980 [Oceanobacillus neutriphilus]